MRQTKGHATYRCDQWIKKGGNHCPIKGEDAHAQPRVHSKQSVDNNIFGSNPAYPIEHTQSCEKVTRDPVPNETAHNSDTKEALTGHVALVVLVVVLVDDIEEGTVSQNTWPDHTGWPDDKLANKSSKAKPNALRTNSQENLEGDRDSLVIENTLREDHIGCIDPPTGRINHD